MAEQVKTGVRLFVKSDQVKSGRTVIVLKDEEMVRLVGWWYDLRYARADAKDDLVVLIVSLTANRQIKEQTAVTCIRALMAQATHDTLSGWVTPEQD
jgi:hypothetical protein